jgi:hypothetical protein
MIIRSIFYRKQQGARMDYIAAKKEAIEKLETMSKVDLDEVMGFVECLIRQKQLEKAVPEKRRPLLSNID